MTKSEQMAFMVESGVTAVIRAKDSSQLVEVAEAIEAGGVVSIEVTMTTPNALGVISEVAKKMGDRVLIGVGSVLDPETARAAILAGAEFVVCPTLNLDTIKLCRRYSKGVIPGAFTPTEILTAWEAGADFVKVFPATALGPKYIKDVKAPLPQVELVPTGGVTAENTGDFIKAGAAMVAAGSSLVAKSALAEGKFDAITETAKRFVAAVKKART
ncbi:MAG: bifunctional 4-hydroxy-2-oxoglutarate aldolase/2-dehydro-3-deoxy-phosphogluconate aldolase [Planctomycetes bacterium]|nr:bifunctional 4-hydroxy-2-oxoglutarate aldolase/2-dehydro-3-deoxy-phosphogluconate aldolase [Planctomycetota bacterium]